MKNLAACELYLATAVPGTPEVRLEIMKAIHALAAQDAGERLRQRRAEIASIRRELEDIARDIRKVHQKWPSLIRSEVRKAGYDPTEPRVPAGNPSGGQWTNEGGSGSSGDSGIVLAQNKVTPRGFTIEHLPGENRLDP